MLFYYIRHGDPIYDPDSLTPLGKKQADALSKRLAVYGLDRIYASTSNRAIMTAEPTADLLKKEIVKVDFANESHAWDRFTVVRDGKRKWLSDDKNFKDLSATQPVISLGGRWYEHPDFLEYKDGFIKASEEIDAFMLELGYEHIKGTGRYAVKKQNDERVALFAHSGFGRVFLSVLLDIPFPQMAVHFDMCHSGMTVIEFKDEDGFAAPRILTLSSDSHIYRDGLPLNYNNHLRF